MHITHTSERGFTLLELSIVLVIIAIVTGMALASGISLVETSRLTATQRKMHIIEEVLMQYRSAHDRLPCPGDLTLAPGSADYGLEAGADASSSIATGTGACTGSGMLPQANFTGAGLTNTWQTAAEGSLPAVTLGLSPDFMLDGWGHKFRYAVDVSMTAGEAFSTGPYARIGCDAGAITVDDVNGNPRSTSAIYALISQGENGHGAYTAGGTTMSTGSVNANELINCHCNSSGAPTTYSATYVQAHYSLDPSNSLDSFDDLVAYKERWQMQTDWDKTGACQYLYVADTGNSRVEVLTLTGGYVNQWGSNGGGPSQFVGPAAVAIDSRGNIWVVDTWNNRVQEFNSTGTYLGQLGCTGTWACGYGSANGQFHYPEDIAFDASGNIWVTDMANNRVEEFNSSGTFVLAIGAGYNGVGGSIGSSGSGNGQFNWEGYQQGIAFDSSGNVWVTDCGNARVQEFNSSGKWLASLAGVGQLGFPQAIAIDSSGNIWVVDGGNDIDEFSSSGKFLMRIGILNGTGTAPGEFWGLQGIAFDSSGNLWAADDSNNRLQEFNSSGTWLGQLGCPGSDGCGAGGSGNGQFHNPNGIALSGR